MDISQKSCHDASVALESRRLKDAKTVPTTSEEKPPAKDLVQPETRYTLTLTALVCRYFRSCCPRFRKVYATVPFTGNRLKSPILPPTERATLILDLDETLVHTSFHPSDTAQLAIEVAVKGTIRVGYVIVRPGLSQFLEACAKHYELVSFTASEKDYSDTILDAIDPTGLIAYRLHRNHCVYYHGMRLKDLSHLGRDLKRTILVDVNYTQNESANFTLQPDNGVKIASFRGDPEDTALLGLLPALEKLKDAEDVRPIICRSNLIHEPLATTVKFL